MGTAACSPDRVKRILEAKLVSVVGSATKSLNLIIEIKTKIQS